MLLLPTQCTYSRIPYTCTSKQHHHERINYITRYIHSFIRSFVRSVGRSLDRWIVRRIRRTHICTRCCVLSLGSELRAHSAPNEIVYLRFIIHIDIYIYFLICIAFPLLLWICGGCCYEIAGSFRSSLPSQTICLIEGKSGREREMKRAGESERNREMQRTGESWCACVCATRSDGRSVGWVVVWRSVRKVPQPLMDFHV